MSAQISRGITIPSFRCKLHRFDGVVIDYIGPFGGWSGEWHIVMRRARK